MKKNFKRVLLFSLIVLTLVVLTVVGASAMTDAEAIDAGNAVRIGDEGGTYYQTLAEAVSAAEAGDTITVIKAHSLSAALTITKSVTIEGQGLQITAAGATTVDSAAVVTLNNFNLSNTATGYGINVTGSSNVTIDGALTSIYATKSFALQCGAGTLTIKDGTFSTGNSAVNVLWANSATSVLTVDGGTFKTTGGNGRLLGMSYAKTFTINGGTFIHGGSNNLFQVTDGPLITINGGDFSYSTTSNNNGIIWTSKATSKFIINGGTFKGNANVLASNGPVEINGGTFYGVAQVTRGSTSLKMTGGTLNGSITTSLKTTIEISGDAVINATGDAITATAAATITLKGGTITSTEGSVLNLSGGAKATVDGATLNGAKENVTDATSSIIINQSSYADDAAAAAAGMSARIGAESEKNYFATLADAIEAAKAGDTITVIKEHALAAALTISKNLTIEGQGLQITAAGVTTIGSNAVVTLNNFKLSNTTSGIGILVNGGAKVTIDGANTHVTATKEIALQITGGSLTVKAGYFTTEKSGKNVLWSNDAASVVVIDGGTFETTGGSGRLLGMSNATEFTINNGIFKHGSTGNNLFQVNGGALLTINNGEFSSPNYTGGIIWTQYATSKFVINGGTFNAKQYVLASNGPVEINGGTFNGIAQLTRNDGGTLTINGGTFNGDITVTKKTSLTISGEAVVKGNISVSSAAATITVEGGEITGSIALGVANAKLTVTGGSITSTGDAITTTAAASIVLNGGKITSTEGAALNLAGGAAAVVNGATLNGAKENVVDATSSITIVGDSYYANDEAAMADGMTVRVGAEGALSTLYFKSLDAAIEAAEAGDIITVLKEHTLPVALTISKNLTIEGNGHLLTAAGATTIDNGAVVTLNNLKLSNTVSSFGINVTGGANVTIVGADTHITATKEIALQVSGGTLTVKDGYFTTEKSGKNVLWSNDAASVVVIDGGKFETTGGSGRLLGMSAAKTFTINNGIFAHGSTGNNLFQVTGGALLTINNGEFSSPNYAGGIIWTSTAASKFVINGGTFTAKENVLASNGPVEINGGTFYGVAQLTRNDGGTLTITGGTFNGNIDVTKKTSLTISGEAVVNGNITVSSDAVVTVDGGTVNGTITMGANSVLNVKGGNFSAPINFNSTNTATVTGGTFDTEGYAFVATSGKIVVLAGSFTSDASIFSLSGATLVITNGTFEAGESIVVATNSSLITVTGGSQTAGSTPYVYDDTCTFSDEKNDTIFAIEGYIARVGEEGVDSSYYKSLTEAIAAAIEKGEELVLIASVALDPITVDGTLTINGNGVAISAANANVALFTVNGSLTIKNANFTTTGTLFAIAGSGSITLESGVYNAATVLSIGANATGTVRFNGGSFTTTATAIVSTGSCSPAIYFAGADITATGSSSAIMSVAKEHAYTGTVYVSAGTLESVDYRAFSGSMNTEMSGGTVKALAFAFWLNGTASTGSFKMTGGTIVAGERGVGSSVGAPITISGGTISTSSGTAIYVENTASLINISGGTFQHTAASTLVLLNIAGGSTLNISGGSFTANAPTATTSLLDLQAMSIANITGGTFKNIDAKEITIRVIKSTLNIFAGYFESADGGYFVRPDGGTADYASTLNIYGGYFLMTSPSASAIVRVGVAASVNDVANIYGGTYHANGGVIFSTANDNATTKANLYSYYAYGNRQYLFVSGSQSSANSIAYPDSSNRYAYNTLAVEVGASLRLVQGSTGIRFTTTIPAGLISMIQSMGGTDISFGTVITPTDYLDGMTTFLPETLKAAGLAVLDIPAVNGIKTDDEGNVTLRAVMTNIKPGNRNRDFSAIAYIKYTVDGKTAVYYSNYRQIENSRAAADIAYAALKDHKDERGGSYLHEIDVNGEIKYSRYTSNQQALLKELYGGDFAAEKVVDIYLIAGQSNAAGYGTYSSDFAAQKDEWVNGYSNIYYSGAGSTFTEDPTAAQYNRIELAPVKVGQGQDARKMGSELGIADVLSQIYNEDSGRDACIVKWADGGTNLLDVVTGSNERLGNWMPPSICEANGYVKTHATKTGAQYRVFMETVDNAIYALEQAGYTQINIKGLFWMQGCSERNLSSMTFNGQTITMNCNSEDYAMLSFDESVPYSYPNVFKALVSDMRKDLGEKIGQDLSDMPVVVGEISEYFNRHQYAYQTRFVNMQKKLANFVDNCYVIDSGRLPVGYYVDDSAHWAAQEMLLVGQMVGVQFANHNFDLDLPHATQLGTPVAAMYDADGNFIANSNNLLYAIHNSPENGTVKLLSDVVIRSTAMLLANQHHVTVDGQNYTLYLNYADIGIRFMGCDITFKDLNVVHSGATEDGHYLSYLYGAQASHITVDGGTWTAHSWMFVMNGGTAHNGSTLTIKDGTFNLTNGKGSENRAIVTTTLATTITIEGGTFNTAGVACAFNNQSTSANWSISGCTINGVAGGYGVRNTKTMNEGYEVVVYNDVVFNNCGKGNTYGDVVTKSK